jgi:hypothetical protein
LTTPRFNLIAVGITCGVGASLFWAAGFAGTRHGLNAGFFPADLTIHRFLWFGIAMLPSVLRTGINDLNAVGWAVAYCWLFSVVRFSRSSAFRGCC